MASSSLPSSSLSSSAAAVLPSTSSHAIPETAIFVTDTCYVRPWEATDLEASAAASNDPEVARWMRDTFPSPYTLEDGRAWLRIAIPEPGSGQPALHFVIASRDDGAFAGAVGLRPRADVQARTWELGYWVGRRHRGRGLATDAVRGFVRWAFARWAEPELIRIQAEVYEGNAGSAAVLRKTGFVEEGVLRRAVTKNGRVLDLHVWGLLREEVEGQGKGEGGVEVEAR
ncbi:hypothetical protein SLS62_000147 [Diatrype stigma]|uniref:N-acetyltransferase domain-containing protein n=1 Tax=Diatrype stigma TaxID=117547 RepID=A0AAN9VAV3_9PEZI